MNVPLELERELVQAALAFREAEPWRELANSDYLLIDEGAAGLRALTVLGNGGAQYGLQSYASSCASEWLFLLDQMSGMPELAPTVALEILEGATLELEAKAATDARDQARLRRVGYRPAPKARRAWPVFRQLRPNYFPWHIDEAAARCLLGDLRRALRWAELAPGLAGRDPDLPVASRPLPAVAADLTTERVWTAADVHWVRLELPKPARPAPLPVNALEISDLLVLPRDSSEWLWLDERPQMAKIAERNDEPPYFPRFGACLDGRTGFSYQPGMGPAARAYGTSAREALEAAIRTRRCVPGEVRTPNAFLAEALGPWAEAMGVPVKVTAGAEPLEEFWVMLAMFGRR